MLEGGVFEDVLDLWKQFWEKHQSDWPSEDPRRDLAMEVRDRLGQLDIVLRYLMPLMERLLPDPEEAQRQIAQVRESLTRLRAGEITDDPMLGAPRPARTLC